jgi:3-phosphoshikimate 1-carboxyvinyltransferase
MQRSVTPSEVKGEIWVPSSKSMTQRAIAAALLSKGQSIILNPSYCNDSLSALSIAHSLGATIDKHNNKVIISGCGKLKEKKLNCGESGLAVRMFSPVAALFSSEIAMTGDGSLSKRPMNMIEEALVQLGAGCNTTNGFLPIIIHGPLKGGFCEIDGSVSSQLLTGLLMALPLAENDSEIRVHNLKSKPYIDMTIQLLEVFGIQVQNTGYNLFNIPANQKYQAQTYEVEGDWSNGAFLLVAGATNGYLKVVGLHTDSKQSDVAILQALEKAGATMIIGPDFIDISKSSLKAFSFDATECPDLFPPLVTLASYCQGQTVIKGVSRLKFKESDRAAALQKEFGKMNIKIEIEDDLMFITGGVVKGSQLDSHNDHRIAMAVTIAALGVVGKVVINDAECVAKSYPDFFNDIKLIGGNIDE